MTIYNMMGWGKGKTTSAIGIAARALGNNEKVLFCQFLKDGNESALKVLNSQNTNDLNFIYLKQNVEGFNLKDCSDFWNGCMEAIDNEQPDLVIFDELNVALDYNLFKYTTENMIDWIKLIGSDRDVYITGRINNHILRHKMIDLADIATNCYCEAHMYNRTCKHCGMDFNQHYEYCPICGNKLQKSLKAKVGREC